MTPFSITRIDRRIAEQFEPLGSKPKFWFSIENRRLLFKADDRGTGEDWAEIVACELCKLIGLPHVHYDLAIEHDGAKDLLPGVICENMAGASSTLFLGNQLLSVFFDPDYPKEQRFRVRQHTVGAVKYVLRRLQPVAAHWSPSLPSGVTTALDSFVGYVLLDAWIANQDRHHENWGMLHDSAGQGVLRLAPTFDHGAALARNLTDAERAGRLATKDQNRIVPSFAKRARSAFYGSESDKKPLSTFDAYSAFAELSPIAGSAWIDRVLAVSTEQIRGILERIPSERISDVGREFTLALLLENQKRLSKMNSR